VTVVATGTGASADRLTKLGAAAGTLTADITTVLPLEQATDGLATIANGNARGKIVIKISD
jgi:NADPH:quinone reductase-like Zn-dependent oxidoreductase